MRFRGFGFCCAPCCAYIAWEDESTAKWAMSTNEALTKAEIRNLIAKSIRDADKSWFNEDYSKQAAEVVRNLRMAGYAVVPVEPDDTIVEAGVESMQAGRHRPADIIKAIYMTMVQKARL